MTPPSQAVMKISEEQDSKHEAMHLFLRKCVSLCAQHSLSFPQSMLQISKNGEEATNLFEEVFSKMSLESGSDSLKDPISRNYDYSRTS